MQEPSHRAGPPPAAAASGAPAPAPTAVARWLSIVESDTPILLIAPHGGSAGPATRAMLNPKVNDLYTAEITRELAARLGAGAIINAGMDRNRLDLNRLSQVMRDAPAILDLIARSVEGIVARSGRATVLLIHGWNVVEPRVDLGIGVKTVRGAIQPACHAHVSASDGFINGPLLRFAEALRRSRIEPTFGLRYPGAGANNLLQAFTLRHAASPVPALKRLAELSARGAIQAAQLELSVSLRIPGRYRDDTIAAAIEAFAERPPAPVAGPHIEIVRIAEPPRRAPRQEPARAASGPRRVGLEFHDAASRIGAMASFDFGPGAAGARVMMVAGRQRIALFTAEGIVERTPHSIRLGALSLRLDGTRVCFDFAGPAVVVEDGTAYLSVERALATARLCETMEVHAEFEAWEGAPARPRSSAEGVSDGTIIDLIAHPAHPNESLFGRVTGGFRISGARRDLHAVGRLGRSFVGIGNGMFKARRMIWAAFPDGEAPHALEARTQVDESGAGARHARRFDRERWHELLMRDLKLAPNTSRRPPQAITALLGGDPPGGEFAVTGEVDGFVMLSRPGPAQTRIVTSVGFARFRLGDRWGAGMFERSARGSAAPGAAAGPAEDADES